LVFNTIYEMKIIYATMGNDRRSEITLWHSQRGGEAEREKREIDR